MLISDGDSEMTPVFTEQAGTQRGAGYSEGLPGGCSLPGLDVEHTLEQQLQDACSGKLS